MAYPSNDGPELDDDHVTGAAELRQFIERIEQLESEKKAIQEDIKEVFSEAKARGFDVKIMRKVIAERKREPDDLAEEQAVLEMYRKAIGLFVAGA